MVQRDLSVWVTALALLVVLTAAAYPNQQEAAEDYATALGVSPGSLQLVYENGARGEELWSFPGGSMQLYSSSGGLRALNGDSSAPFNQNTSAVGTDEQAIERAEQFITAYASGLEIPTPGETATALVSTDGVFEGRWVDISPVVGGMAGFPCWSVRVADSGAVLTCVYTEASGDMPSATPTLSQQQAASVVGARTGDQVQVGSASLSFVLDETGAARLIWDLALEGQAGDYAALVDAHSGDVIWLGKKWRSATEPTLWQPVSTDQPIVQPAGDPEPAFSLPAIAVGTLAAVLSLVLAKAFQK